MLDDGMKILEKHGGHCDPVKAVMIAGMEEQNGNRACRLLPAHEATPPAAHAHNPFPSIKQLTEREATAGQSASPASDALQQYTQRIASCRVQCADQSVATMKRIRAIPRRVAVGRCMRCLLDGLSLHQRAEHAADEFPADLRADAARRGLDDSLDYRVLAPGNAAAAKQAAHRFADAAAKSAA